MYDYEQQDEQQAIEAEKAQVAENLNLFGSRLRRLAGEQVQKRSNIEERWLNDLRQYHGKYDAKEIALLKQNETAEIFVNITRNKANAAEARIQDMLFPTDDRNWAIAPTPIPELEAVKNQSQEASDILRLAKEKAERMQTAIDDQLTEANYQAKARDMLRDAVIYGTGIIKAPVIIGKTKKKWSQDEFGNSVLQIVEDLTPSVEYVDIWDFYPDMTSQKLCDCDFFFERHKWTLKQLRDFSKLPNVFQEQVQKVAKSEKGDTSANNRENDIRSITGMETHVSDNRYEVWEYHGSISKQELITVLASTDDPMLEQEEVDELNDEIEAVVFFSSSGKVLKVSLNPLDTQERPYSALNWEVDDGSCFGFGIPYLMRSAQIALNAAWRMMLDNAGQAVTDQVVVNDSIVEPNDGKWELGKKKIWRLKDENRNVNEAFGVFETRNHQPYYSNIIQLARQFADEETNMPLIAQGESAAHVTQTSSGMAMLMNSANIVLRRAIKNWDDDVTNPLIARFYDWNMQFNQDNNIKGDYSVKARGSSALLVREKQQENLMIFSNISAQNQELMMRRDWEGLDREIAKALEVPYENITLSDEEIQQRQAQMQQQQPEQQADPVKMQELQLKQMMFESEIQLKAQAQQRDYELKVAELALKENLTMEQMRIKLETDLLKDKTAREKAAGELSLKNTQANLQAQNLSQGYDTF
jgi:hypothetical protein